VYTNSNNYICKFDKPKGRRHIGRPRKRWRDQFHFEDTRNRNQT